MNRHPQHNTVAASMAPPASYPSPSMVRMPAASPHFIYHAPSNCQTGRASRGEATKVANTRRGESTPAQKLPSNDNEPSMPSKQNQHCCLCDGSGQRGVFGPRGLGFLSQPCPGCTRAGAYSGCFLPVPRSCLNVAAETACRIGSADDADLLESNKDEPVDPAMVFANVYWMRNVAFDEDGKMQRRVGKAPLSWGQKFVKSVLGVYHVGIQVHGVEYVFGSYSASDSRQMGSRSSGVYMHRPRKAGPRYLFKEAVELGITELSSKQVATAAANLGCTAFQKTAYDTINHNCVDFAEELCEALGVDELPSWCHRGASAARLIGVTSCRTAGRGEREEVIHEHVRTV